ncbi:hypothetical protein CPT_Phriendly_017 [Vibrio phage Phriendly]|nr:hypothetical protein CPT_Phriendly_017 [Vibrio phage Phriendly]
MKIHQMFNLAKPAADDSFGVELELEYNNNPVFSNEWKIEHDGSLRHMGFEYVMRRPMSFDESVFALDNLKKAFDKGNNHPRATNLASSHIHINVAHLDFEEFKQLVALIMLFEPHIGKHGGQDRWLNYFAVSTQEGGLPLRELIACHDEEDFIKFIRNTAARDWRYSGINFVSVRKYGSLEIRYLGAQPDPRGVIPWLRFYDTLRNCAQGDIMWHKIFELASGGDLEVLKNTFNCPFDIDRDDLIDGVRSAQDLVFPVFQERSGAPKNKTFNLTNYYR